MLIPLGFLGTGVKAGFELIQTQVLASSAASVTFNLSALQQATYKHLQLRIVGRTDRASNQDGAKIRFNGGTSTNYAFQQLSGSGTSVTGYSDATSLYWYLPIGALSASTAVANSFGVSVSDILDAFSTAKNKSMRVLSGDANGVVFTAGLWVDTSAISAISIQPDQGTNFVSGSRFSVYGVRG